VRPDSATPAPDEPLGVVLAGGGSTRFGSPKGLSRVGGARLLDRVAAALREAASDLLLVANDPGAADWLAGVACIGDALPGGGGLSGVHAALAYARRPVIVAAWDMPFLSGPLLRELARRCVAEDAQACVPLSASPVGMEPFCACYAPSCLDALERAIAGGNAGGARFARALSRVSWMPASETAAYGDPARLFFSVNTPADLQRAEAMAAGTW
jgi:molybdopterin-guanine dinucleotide biosynthesis protein A